MCFMVFSLSIIMQNQILSRVRLSTWKLGKRGGWYLKNTKYLTLVRVYCLTSTFLVNICSWSWYLWEAVWIMWFCWSHHKNSEVPAQVMGLDYTPMKAKKSINLTLWFVTHQSKNMTLSTGSKNTFKVIDKYY